MKTEHWDRIRELFDEVSRHPPEAREGVLTALCPDEAGLRNEILSLLEHDERAEPDFLAPPSPVDDPSLPDAPDPLIGARIGKYTIRRVIAGGGMGRVYEAEQDNPKRTVALNVVPTWAWSPAGLRRFEFEVEALARLTHPNIAQIYDAGTCGGNAETPKLMIRAGSGSDRMIRRAVGASRRTFSRATVRRPTTVSPGLRPML